MKYFKIIPFILSSSYCFCTISQEKILHPPKMVCSSVYELLCGLSNQFDQKEFDRYRESSMDFYRPRGGEGAYLIRAFNTQNGYIFMVDTWENDAADKSKFRVELAKRGDEFYYISILDAESTFGEAYKELINKQPVAIKKIHGKPTPKSILRILFRIANTIY
jgi:hypothetical protein